MLQVFIGKSGTTKYAASKSATAANSAVTPDVLADGAVGVFASANGVPALLVNVANPTASVTGGKLSATNAAAAMQLGIDSIFVAQGTADGYKISQRIPIRNAHFMRVNSAEFAAGSKQMTTVGDAANALTLPGSPGDEDTLNLYIRTNNINYATRGYNVSMNKFIKINDGTTVSSPNVGQVIDELAARINADTYASVAATAVNTAASAQSSAYLHLEGETVSTSFEALVNGWDDSGNVSISSTANVLPVGTQSQVQDLEFRSFQFQGYFQERDGIFPRETSKVTSTAYDLHFIKFKALTTQGASDNPSDTISEVIVAFPDGDNDAAGENQGDFEAVIEAIAQWTGVTVQYLGSSAADTA